MMNKITRLFSLLILLILVFVLVGCSKKKTLDTPNISLNEAILTWEAVDHASKYLVTVNEEEYETISLEYNLKSIKANTYHIKVKALGDNKKYLDSADSSGINITVNDKVSIEKDEIVNNKIKYRVIVESKNDVLGFIIGIKYDANKLSITENDIDWTSLLPSTWIYDVNIDNGNIEIAVTGLDDINVRLKQSLVYLDFQVIDQSGDVIIDSYIIDNG